MTQKEIESTIERGTEVFEIESNYLKWLEIYSKPLSDLPCRCELKDVLAELVRIEYGVYS